MYNKPDKFIPSLYGGLIIGAISAIPFLNLLNCLCCAGIMLGGFLSIFFYKDNFTPDTPPFTAGDCMAVGVFAGLIGAVVAVTLETVMNMLFGNVVGKFALEWIQRMNIDIPEESWDAIERALTSSLSFGSIIINLFAGLILNSIFGLLGGLIGYNIYKPKPTLMQPPTQQNVA
jgi:hypothetical protein